MPAPLNAGYSLNYNHAQTRAVAEWLCEVLDVLEDTYGSDLAVVVSGNSGVSAGFAALALRRFNLVLVRKPGENSHGSPIEGPQGFVINKYVMLDDIVDTGETLRRTAKRLSELEGVPVQNCVGVILYRSYMRDMPESKHLEILTDDGACTHNVPVFNEHKIEELKYARHQN